MDRDHYLFDNYIWTGKVPSVNRRRQKSVYVALKRIYVTSSPSRILNELELMEDLRHCQHIAYLITAFRTHDQIIAVMPYSRHSDFRVGSCALISRNLPHIILFNRSTTASCPCQTSSATSVVSSEH